MIMSVPSRSQLATNFMGGAWAGYEQLSNYKGCQKTRRPYDYKILL